MEAEREERRGEEGREERRRRRPEQDEHKEDEEGSRRREGNGKRGEEALCASPLCPQIHHKLSLLDSLSSGPNS